MGNCGNKGINNFHTDQDFHQIRTQLRKSGTQFEDDKFPASNLLLTRTNGTIFSYRDGRGGRQGDEIKWLRPREICPGLEPKMVVGKRDRFDINQGEIGDCWFLAPLASLAENEHCFNKVVPTGQDFGGRNYVGMFRFRFYRFGEWFEVVVDDRLPTRQGKLVFLRARETNEFWSPLLEKAYAKFYGSYACIEGGLSMDAAVDFTGGIPQMLDLEQDLSDEDARRMYHLLKMSHANGALLTASLGTSHRREGVDKGLQAAHAYSLTKVRTVRAWESFFRSSTIPLVRLRNPHGDYKEWSGDWSDKSRQWEKISSRVKKKLDLQKKEDGEFYMSFNRDFLKYFGKIEIVNLNPVRMEVNEERLTRKFNMYNMRGEWRRGVSAGGINNFELNPQFQFSIVNKRDRLKTGSVVVSLTQKVKRRKDELLSIGFRVYKVQDQGMVGEKLASKFVNNALNKVDDSGAYINSRDVTKTLQLPEGDYAVVPSTYQSGGEAEFLVRLFVDSRWGCRVTQGELVSKSTIKDYRCCFAGCGSLVNCCRAGSCCCKSNNCCCNRSDDVYEKTNDETVPLRHIKIDMI